MGIRIEDLTVTFKNKVTAIDHADLEIPKGIFGLLGENGAGKTTLMRVSYIMAKMLETYGTYEKYEIADLMVLALLHDIGAYKTDDVRKQLTFEAKNPIPHSVYGYLFLKYLSPLDEQSKMVLYHHTD